MLDYGKLSKIHVKNGCGKNQFTIGKFPKMSAPDTHPPHHTFPGFFPDSPLEGGKIKGTKIEGGLANFEGIR